MRSDKPIRIAAFEGLLSPETMAARPAYERCELEFTGETERRMRAYLAKKPQGKFGRHSYAVAESEDLRRRRRLSARYQALVGLPDEAGESD